MSWRGDTIIQSDSMIVNETGGILAGRAVMFDTTQGKCKYPTGSNLATICGVANEDKDDTRPISIVVQGDVSATAASAIAIGDWVYNSGTAGKFAAVPTGVTPSANWYAVGRAVTAASGDGKTFLLRLSNNPRVIAS